jgi:spore germination protein YaaH
MRRILTRIVLAAALGAALTGAAQAQGKATQPVALFYLMETPKSTRSFEQHIDKIGLLVPTWYGVSKDGLVTGSPNPGILAKARAARLPVMPIISLTDRAGLHQLMENEAAKKAMNEA